MTEDERTEAIGRDCLRRIYDAGLDQDGVIEVAQWLVIQVGGDCEIDLCPKT